MWARVEGEWSELCAGQSFVDVLHDGPSSHLCFIPAISKNRLDLVERWESVVCSWSLEAWSWSVLVTSDFHFIEW